MKLTLSLGCLAVLSWMMAMAADSEPKGKGKGQGKGGGGGGGASVEPAVVPGYLFNLWLARPGEDRATLSVLAWRPMQARILYGPASAPASLATSVKKLAPGEPAEFLLEGLSPSSECRYQLEYVLDGGTRALDEVRSFHTRRSPGAGFRFVVQADSHLDTSTDVRVYQQSLANMLADKPDFMVDLGDTTMVDKFGTFYTRSSSQYLAQRFYIGRLAHSVPVYLVLGNHDGEKGERLRGTEMSMPLWSVGMRKKHFPNPEPGGIYTGNETPMAAAGLLQNYYAWTWGDALFVVLDPYWNTTSRQGNDNWGMTLGEEQYRWLERTLQAAQAPHRFVFIHHLAGGRGKDARGGVAAAPYAEWGGLNTDGTQGFAEHRPGWALPIHPLLVKHGVDVVFHGHDHLYVKEELDDVIYQEVPQPGHPGGGTRSAEEYGYQGRVLASPGHLRVTVTPAEARVEYVRTAVDGVTQGVHQNGDVEDSYILPAKR